MRWTLLLALLPSLAFAQSQSTPRPEDLGTVTGHITCSDTQRPARLAEVALVSTRPPDRTNGAEVHDDGSFHFANVPEGSYTLTVSQGRDTITVEIPHSPPRPRRSPNESFAPTATSPSPSPSTPTSYPSTSSSPTNPPPAPPNNKRSPLDKYLDHRPPKFSLGARTL